MSVYAIITSGVVSDIVSLPDGELIQNLPFLTDTQKENAVIVPDDQTVQVHVGWLYSDGVFSPNDPPAPPLTPAQQAALAFGNGLTITSTGTPAISGTYPITTDWQQKITSVSVYIAINSKFPGSQNTYVWPDIAGNQKTFASTGLFLEWSTAVADYVSILDNIVLFNTGSLPNSTVTIS